MQYCPNCKIQIRGKKAHCPLCQRELMDADRTIHFPDSVLKLSGAKAEERSAEAKAEERLAEAKAAESPAAERLAEAKAADNPTKADVVLRGTSVSTGSGYSAAFADASLLDDDPFVRLPSPKVSFMLMVRVVTFICVSLEILLGAAQIISGSSGWFFAAMLFVLLGWADFRVAVYYRNNLIRMLTTQAYIIMAACLLIAHITKSGSWAVTWVVPLMFCLLIAVTFVAARAQGMELHEYILYPAFDVLMSLLQIIPIALGKNPDVAPAVICIAIMLILVSSLIIFRGKMLREAAEKYLHF